MSGKFIDKDIHLNHINQPVKNTLPVFLTFRKMALYLATKGTVSA